MWLCVHTILMWGITWLKERAHQVSYMTHQRGRLTDLLKHFIVSEVITEEKLEELEKKETHSTNYLSKWRMLQMPRADMFWAKLSFFCCSVACLAQIEAIEMGHQSQLVVGSCEDVTRTHRLGGDMKRRYRSWIREVMKQWKLQPDDVIAFWGHVFFILFKIITKNPST